MQCPRCGFQNDYAAAWCVQCGLTLSSAGMHSAPAGASGPIDGRWREEGTGYGEPTDEAPSWLTQALRQSAAPPNTADAPSNQPFPNPPSPMVDPQTAASGPSVPFGQGWLGAGPGGWAGGVPPAPADAGAGAGAGAQSGIWSQVPLSPSIVDAWPPLQPPPGAPNGPTGTSGGLSLVVAPALEPGAPLKNGRYRVLHRMHASGSYHPQANEPPLMVASDMQLGNERVLVQELPLATANQAEMDGWRRLLGERITMLAQSLGAPRLLDHFAERGRHFVVYELPSGDLLLDRLQRSRGPLDEKAAIGITLQLLDALDAYERQRPQFVHGNISPANIVLRPGGQLALIGFSPTALMHPGGRVEQGAAGGVGGYAAPEQLRGQLSPRSDLFSVCAVLYHAVTGVAPSPRSRGVFAPARQQNPNVSLELEELLSQGLRMASGQRFQSARELRRALEPLARGQLTHVPVELRADPPSAEDALIPVRDAHGRLALPRRRAWQNPLLLLGSIVLLITLIGGSTLFVFAPRSPSLAGMAATATPNALAQLFQTQGIGLSGGEYIFDTDGPNNALKQRGAQALNAGDLPTAQRDFANAMGLEPQDAEGAIYAEDVGILQAKAPYVTVVAAVTFSSQDSASARQELQGVYLAQHRINSLDLLPFHLRVRVLVLNSGQAAGGAVTAANVLLQQIQRGNAQHLAGIIGWPDSDETRAALSAIAPAGLAVLSPTATADRLGGRAAAFFPLVPSDSQQAAELATAAATQLNGQHVLVLQNSADAVSASQAKSFSTTLEQFPAVASHTATYTSGDARRFGQVAQTAQLAGDDIIFLSCGEQNCDQDSALLAQAVAGAYTFGGTVPHILTTHQAYTPALLGLGSGPAATLARGDPGSLKLLDVTLLTTRDEWQAVGVSSAAQPTFISDYQAQYGPQASADGLPAPDAISILSYDALRVLLAATARGTRQQGDAIQYATPTQVRLRLLQLDAKHAFLGVGGAIAYTDTGDLVGKSLVIAQLSPRANAGPDAPVALPQIVAVTGGQSEFCGGASCVPS
ncbi:MAG TPA: hypothetical protein VFU88_08510 [Ktedonobacterales bacterium]|nr:hypothetical protein [Ktedonobacterales bacterium]